MIACMLYTSNGGSMTDVSIYGQRLWLLVMNQVNQEKQGLRTQEEWYNPEIEMSA